MLKLLYDLILHLGACAFLPKMLLDGRKGKYRHWKVRFFPPSLQSRQPVIWVHAVSVGEMLAAMTLLQALRERYSPHSLIFSCHTETAFKIAQEQFHFLADQIVLLPFDFSWAVRKMWKHLSLSQLIFVEGDVWWNLAAEAKKKGAFVSLISAKLSEKSAKRFRLFPLFFRAMFSRVDQILVQNAVYEKRWRDLGYPSDRLKIKGNLKLAQLPEPLTVEERIDKRKQWGFSSEDKLVILASTHDPEERLFLSSIPIEKTSTVWVVVPRHPHRSAVIEALFQERGFQVHKSSQGRYQGGRYVLVDEMGKLMELYSMADAAFVGGSFCPHVGGHNVLEPIAWGVPTYFGPETHTQQELVSLALQSGHAYPIDLGQIPSLVMAWNRGEFLPHFTPPAFGKDILKKILRELPPVEKNECK